MGEAAATGMFPVISTAKQALQAQGAIGALMTGSGSAVFGLFRDPSQARRAQRNLARHDGWQSFAAQLTP